VWVNGDWSVGRVDEGYFWRFYGRLAMAKGMWVLKRQDIFKSLGVKLNYQLDMTG
jgi:hypothetical protein